MTMLLEHRCACVRTIPGSQDEDTYNHRPLTNKGAVVRLYTMQRDLAADHKTDIQAGLTDAFRNIISAVSRFVHAFVNAHGGQFAHRAKPVEERKIELFAVQMPGHQVIVGLLEVQYDIRVMGDHDSALLRVRPFE